MSITNSRFTLFFSSIIFCCMPLLAQDNISDSLTMERIKCIQKTLSKDEANTKRWWYGWLCGYGAATLAQGTLSYVSEIKETKQDMTLGAVTSALGVIGLFISPIKLRPRNVTDRIKYYLSDSQVNGLTRLNRAEELLKRAAFIEKEAKSWKIHAICGAVNLGSGLVTWMVFKRTIWDGVEIFAISTAITEFQIWTSPSRALKDYQNYCAKNNLGEKSDNRISKISWTVGLSANSVHLKILF